MQSDKYDHTLGTVSGNEAAAPAQTKRRFYSTGQAAIGSGLGGPLAGILMLIRNYKTMDNYEGAKTAGFVGALAMVALAEIVLFLPETFPDYVIPGITAGIFGMLVQQQYTENLQHAVAAQTAQNASNWYVFGLVLAGAAILFLLVVVQGMLTELVFPGLIIEPEAVTPGNDPAPGP